MTAVPADIVKAAADYCMTVQRVAKGLSFVSDVTGKSIWTSEDAAAARRFLRACDLHPSMTAQIVKGQI